MSNATITHIIYKEKQSEKTIHEQSISHYQTINSYMQILISIQTDHGIHILACTYVHDFTQARSTHELQHTYVGTSLYTAHNLQMLVS